MEKSRGLRSGLLAGQTSLLVHEGNSLQDAAPPGAYGQSCGHEGPKCRNILQKIANGTLSNLLFTNEKKFDIQQVVHQQNDVVWASPSFTKGRIVTRRQHPQSVMVWVAIKETGRSSLFLCSLEANWTPSATSPTFWRVALPWTKKHLQGVPWSLQQDSAPSHPFKITQSWIQRKVPSFISKEV